ncbi:MAG: glycosyltransferase [Actinobacteria bacterium]|nr:glycosyltransferase [Actinomycetota bacterium]
MRKVIVIGPNWYGNSVENCQEGFNKNNIKSYIIKYRPFHYFEGGFPLYNFIKYLFYKLYSIYFNIKFILVSIFIKPDLIFVFKGEVILKYSILLLKKIKIKIVVWWQDNPLKYNNLLDQYRIYDEFFIFDMSYSEELIKHNVKNVTWLPCAFNKSLLTVPDKSNKIKDFDIIFAGLASDERISFFENIAKLGFKIKLMGNSFKKSKLLNDKATLLPYTTPKEIFNHYSNAKLGININQKQSITGVNCRTFELCGFGMFQLTDFRKDLISLYNIGEELVVYENMEDLANKVVYYLKNDAAREKIAVAGMARTLKDHTYQSRMKYVIEKLGLS